MYLCHFPFAQLDGNFEIARAYWISMQIRFMMSDECVYQDFDDPDKEMALSCVDCSR